jgi:hypothetical protein
MKLGRKIIAASALAAGPFWLVGALHAAPIGMALGLKDAARSDVETVRAVTVGRFGGIGRAGIAGAGWAGGPRGWRAGSGLAAGAIVGGAVAATQPWYGYGGYGPDNGASYYGYDPGYPTGYFTSVDGGYGYGYGPAPGGDYWQSCSHVGGPKTGTWACR